MRALLADSLVRGLKVHSLIASVIRVSRSLFLRASALPCTRMKNNKIR